MHRVSRVPVLLTALTLWSGTGAATEAPARATFEHLAREVAAGWNAGDARRAADCFSPDAIYSEPPARQLHRGREALFEFFGGEAGRSEPMRMTWHHLAYDERTGVGMGEFSFRLGEGNSAHGVVVMRVSADGITNWREYYYDSDLEWEQFTAANPF